MCWWLCSCIVPQPLIEWQSGTNTNIFNISTHAHNNDNNRLNLPHCKSEWTHTVAPLSHRHRHHHHHQHVCRAKRVPWTLCYKHNAYIHSLPHPFIPIYSTHTHTHSNNQHSEFVCCLFAFQRTRSPRLNNNNNNHRHNFELDYKNIQKQFAIFCLCARVCVCNNILIYSFWICSGRRSLLVANRAQPPSLWAFSFPLLCLIFFYWWWLCVYYYY